MFAGLDAQPRSSRGNREPGAKGFSVIWWFVYMRSSWTENVVRSMTKVKRKNRRTGFVTESLAGQECPPQLMKRVCSTLPNCFVKTSIVIKKKPQSPLGQKTTVKVGLIWIQEEKLQYILPPCHVAKQPPHTQDCYTSFSIPPVRPVIVSNLYSKSKQEPLSIFKVRADPCGET